MIGQQIRIGLGTLAAVCWLATSAHAIIISSSQNTATQGAGVTPAATWDGVGNIILNNVDLDGNTFETVDDQWGSGTLIRNGQGVAKYILTAAHVLFSDNANTVRIPNANFRLNFPEPNNGINAIQYGVVRSAVHPSFNGNTLANDIAILELGVDLGGTTTSYNINRPTLIADERATMGSGLVGNKVGFGRSGDGVNGDTANPVNTPNAGDPNAQQGTRRNGTNFVELFGPVVAGNNVRDAFNNLLTAPANTLIYDFDNHVAGTNGPLYPAGNPALGAALSAQFTGPSTAVGTQEADTAPGDSGGPMFLFHTPTNQWLVVGVTSYGTDGGANPPPPFGSRFGDIAVDTRVQSFAGWITMQIPEPGSLILTFCGLGVIVCARRMRL